MCQRLTHKAQYGPIPFPIQKQALGFKSLGLPFGFVDGPFPDLELWLVLEDPN